MLQLDVITCRNKSSNYSNPFSTGINTRQRSGSLANKQCIHHFNLYKYCYYVYFSLLVQNPISRHSSQKTQQKHTANIMHLSSRNRSTVNYIGHCIYLLSNERASPCVLCYPRWPSVWVGPRGVGSPAGTRLSRVHAPQPAPICTGTSDVRDCGPLH